MTAMRRPKAKRGEPAMVVNKVEVGCFYHLKVASYRWPTWSLVSVIDAQNSGIFRPLLRAFFGQRIAE